jgi:hypothetical protein
LIDNQLKSSRLTFNGIKATVCPSVANNAIKINRIKEAEK